MASQTRQTHHHDQRPQKQPAQHNKQPRPRTQTESDERIRAGHGRQGCQRVVDGHVGQEY